MAVQYLGLKEINGPLVALDNVTGVSYDEVAEITLSDGSTRSDRRHQSHTSGVRGNKGTFPYQYKNKVFWQAHGDASFRGASGTCVQRRRQTY